MPPPTPKCRTHLEAPSHIQALGQAGTGEWVEPRHLGDHIRPEAETSHSSWGRPRACQQWMGSDQQVSIPLSCTQCCRVQESGTTGLTPGPWASGSQCWRALAKHCRPGLAAAQPRSLPTPQAGGTMPAAKTAGSGFADVSEEAQGLGQVRPSPHL